MLSVDNIEWVDVEGFEGRYQVSRCGLIRSIQDNHGRYRERLIAQNKSSTVDYLYVKLFIKDNMVNRAVHRLVAKAFVPNAGSKPMVNHIDGDKRNNHADNLEWATCSENHLHAFNSGLRNASHVADRNRGVKSGSKSKYHNVSWDASRARWKAAVKEGGVTLFQKRFKLERDAALYVNEMLDLYKLTNRPRNIVD